MDHDSVAGDGVSGMDFLTNRAIDCANKNVRFVVNKKKNEWEGHSKGILNMGMGLGKNHQGIIEPVKLTSAFKQKKYVLTLNKGRIVNRAEVDDRHEMKLNFFELDLDQEERQMLEIEIFDEKPLQ